MTERSLRGALTLLAICLPALAHAAPGLDAEIRWTRYGLPHVKAKDHASLGYGYGYAIAADSLCLLADRVITLRGERSRWFGASSAALVGFAKTTNLDSDLFYRVQLSNADVAASLIELSPSARDLARGYAAGFNRYVRDMKPEARAAACQGVLPDMQAADVARATMQIGAIWKGLDVASSASASTWEALESPASGASFPVEPASGDGAARHPPMIGSNAWAYGSDATGSGAAIVVANPHTSWAPSWQRMHQVHLTIPGELDVMGADFAGLPVPVAGYTRDIAWALKSPMGTDFHVLLALEVRNGSKPFYRVDGRGRQLAVESVDLEVRGDDGSLRSRRFRLPRSHLGVIYKLAAAPGRPSGWYAITDPNAGNALAIDQMLAAAKARNVAEFQRAVADHRGLTARLVAGDRHGEVLYIDSGPLLDIDDATLVGCFAEKREWRGGLQAGPRNVLDGARGECAVRDAAGKPKLADSRRIPAVTTRGILELTTDSYRYAVFGKHLAGYPLLVGDPLRQPEMRALMSHRHIGEALADKRITVPEAADVMLSNRNYVAETFLDAILAACPRTEKNSAAARACSILAAWDRRNDCDSRGTLLFSEAWPRLEAIEGFYASAFDPGDPYRARSISTAPAVAANILQSLADTMKTLEALGLRGDEPWGTMLARPTPKGRVPLHGGDGDQGVLNVVGGGPLQASGYADVQYGSSYIQVVTWDGEQPVAGVLLAHGQSPDPASPHYSDQLSRFAKKRLTRPPFTDAEIAADPALKVQRVREGDWP